MSRDSEGARGKCGDLGPNAEIWVQMQVSSSFFINSKANRQKPNNNQERDTTDGNVVLMSRMHETECNRYNNQHSKLQTHTQVSAGRGNLARQRDGGEVYK